jgi:hypothetical protein
LKYHFLQCNIITKLTIVMNINILYILNIPLSSSIVVYHKRAQTKILMWYTTASPPFLFRPCFLIHHSFCFPHVVQCQQIFCFLVSSALVLKLFVLEYLRCGAAIFANRRFPDNLYIFKKIYRTWFFLREKGYISWSLTEHVICLCFRLLERMWYGTPCTT